MRMRTTSLFECVFVGFVRAGFLVVAFRLWSVALLSFVVRCWLLLQQRLSLSKQ